jgi:hypothetical protein
MGQEFPRSKDDVTVRCDLCARDLGPAAPALALCTRSGDGWWFMALERQRLRRHDAQQAMAHHERQVSNFDRPPSRTYGFVQRRGTRGADFVCRRCGHRPRISRRALYELAEQALAAGRHDAYI